MQKFAGSRRLQPDPVSVLELYGALVSRAVYLVSHVPGSPVLREKGPHADPAHAPVKAPLGEADRLLAAEVQIVIFLHEACYGLLSVAGIQYEPSAVIVGQVLRIIVYLVAVHVPRRVRGQLGPGIRLWGFLGYVHLHLIGPVVLYEVRAARAPGLVRVAYPVAILVQAAIGAFHHVRRVACYLRLGASGNG